MKLELALLMASMAGIAIPEEQRSLSAEAFEEAFDEESFTTQILAKQSVLEAAVANAAKLPTVEAQLAALQTEKAALETFKTDNEPKLAQLGEVATYKAGLVSEVLKASALVGGAVDPVMKATFEASDINTLKVFKQTFETQLDAKFPMECKSCGGHEVVRASVEVGEEGGEGDSTKPQTKSLEQIRNDRRNAKVSPDWMGK